MNMKQDKGWRKLASLKKESAQKSRWKNSPVAHTGSGKLHALPFR
jgi:hypothetical protein